jgi:hypothetical protein
MPYEREIAKALDELIANEAGMKFQGLAVVLAKQKWPRLVASERKWDNGLDAYSPGDLEPDGNGMGVACSLTAEYDKIERTQRRLGSTTQMSVFSYSPLPGK